ncbi:D-xylose-proton symporter-like 2 [Eucalyptus grandis]|uniref:D-xylose-proton symporter-like 2 n=1 Tax=Eucalyptus grandis TaxID=71139 RepID=UPI00192EAA23|nr:D-xylose-proton symporter-like 2 [Eucalyptus grandis]
MASDPERPTRSSLAKVGKSSGEIGDATQEPLINGNGGIPDSYSVAAAVLPFLFPALGGLLYGYDIGATSCATISVESATLSGISWYDLSSLQIGLITSGSLYGALIGSVLAFSIADFTGSIFPHKHFALNLGFTSSVLGREVRMVHLYSREKKGTYSGFSPVSRWSSHNSISTGFCCYGGWALCVRYHNSKKTDASFTELKIA